MGMPSRFTKWHGSLGRRCGLLSNYFDLLLFIAFYLSIISLLFLLLFIITTVIIIIAVINALICFVV